MQCFITVLEVTHYATGVVMCSRQVEIMPVVLYHAEFCTSCHSFSLCFLQHRFSVPRPEGSVDVMMDTTASSSGMAEDSDGGGFTKTLENVAGIAGSLHNEVHDIDEAVLDSLVDAHKEL
jgi:hypothetical protein